MDKEKGLFELRELPFDPPRRFFGMGVSGRDYGRAAAITTVNDVIFGGWTEEELFFIMNNESNPIKSFYGDPSFFIHCPNIHRAIKTIFKGAKSRVLFHVTSKEKDFCNHPDTINAAADFIKRGGKIEMFICKDSEEIAYGIWKSSKFIMELGQSLAIYNMSSVDLRLNEGMMIVDDRHILIIREYLEHWGDHQYHMSSDFGLYFNDLAAKAEKRLRSRIV